MCAVFEYIVFEYIFIRIFSVERHEEKTKKDPELQEYIGVSDHFPLDVKDQYKRQQLGPNSWPVKKEAFAVFVQSADIYCILSSHS